jgi:LPXTG-motif cell wall-anchored protein
MQRSFFIAFLMLCLLTAGGTTSAQTQSTSSEVRQFEVLAVDGNKVVVRGQKGTQEITVPPEFQLTVDGKPVTVEGLKPGMKGTARITTTTTVTPVHVTEVRNGVIMQKSGNSIIVRGDKGIHMFTEGDATKRGIRLTRDGRPIAFTDLNTGDRLTATIITEQPPKVMTERQVEASLASASGGAPTAAAPAAPTAGASAAPSGTSGAAPRRLPKTASPLPLFGLAGAGALLAGVAMTLARRRRAEH